MGVWLRTGSTAEPDAEAGISHFLEHMLFKRTAHRTGMQIAAQMDRVGGEFNAYTSTEYTCFVLTLPVRSASVGAEILCDVLLNSRFTPQDVKIEKRVVREEMSMVEDNPEDSIFDDLFERIYPGYPMGRPILGNRSSVGRISVASLRRYFQRQYRPENVVISAAGDITHQRLTKLFAPLTKRNWPGRARGLAPFETPPLSPDFHPGFWWVPGNGEQVHVGWVCPGVARGSSLEPAAWLLSAYLGEGSAALVNRKIREEKGLAYTVYSNHLSFRGGGAFMLYAAIKPERASNCLRIVEQTLKTGWEGLIRPGVLRDVKGFVKGAEILSEETMEARMSTLAKNEIYSGRYISLEETLRRIDRVKPAQIGRVAKAMFLDASPAILAIGPRTKGAAATRLHSWQRPDYCRT